MAGHAGGLAGDDEQHVLHQVIDIRPSNPRRLNLVAEQEALQVVQPSPVIVGGRAGEAPQQAGGGFHE